VAPFNVLALRLATFVLEETVNGLVPVLTVETKALAVTEVPTYKFLAIPTPPETTSAPVVLEDESVVLLKVTTPLADKLVKEAELGVVLPIEVGLANVPPFRKDTFKFPTTVVLEIVNGAVPVANVLVIIPVVLIVV
jgi:hypothetical protein